MEKHPGIRIDKIPFKGVPGLIAGVATLTIFLVGIPAIRGFVLISAVAGVIVGVVLYMWHKHSR